MSSDDAQGLRIAVMGSGGVGGYFGARLADAGFDVSFIARGEHLAAIRAVGLGIESPVGDATINPAMVTDDPRTIGEVDVVMFTTKLYDVRDAGELCRPLIGPDTVVLSFPNGIDSEDILIDVLGAAHVAGGVARRALRSERRPQRRFEGQSRQRPAPASFLTADDSRL